MATDAARYQLSPGDNERIFRDHIVRSEFTGCEPQARPVVVFIGGQTGAGKTAVTRMITNAFEHGSGYANANMDFYSPYHPNYEALRRRDESTASAHIRHDAEVWWLKAQQHAISQRYNVVIETAMRSTGEFEDLIPQFRDAGYRVEVAILAVPESLSRLGILDRYWNEVRDLGHGRFIDPSIHDECYRGVLRGAAALDQTDHADRVFVFRRDGNVTYSNSRDEHGQWNRPPTAANAVATERSRRWTPPESTWFQNSINKLQAEIDPRWHGELDQVRSLATRLLPSLPAEPSISPKRVTSAVMKGRKPPTDRTSDRSHDPRPRSARGEVPARETRRER